MGNQASPQGQRNQMEGSVSIPPIQTMKLQASGNDVRYGEIKIMQAQTGQLFVFKQTVFQEQEAWKQFKSRSEQKVNHEADTFVIRLLSFQHSTESEMCSTFTKATSVYEYYPHDLRRDIEDLRGQGMYYQEIEIVAMMKCIVDALISLNFARQAHGDLRPSNILMSGPSVHNQGKLTTKVPSPIYKITNIEELTSFNAYKRVIMKSQEDGTLLLSPEQLNELRFDNTKPSYDPYRSDLFSLGLVAIEMATLQDLAPIYEMDERIMRINLLEKFIEMVSARYSERLIKILEHLLNFSPDKRPDLMMAPALFQSYQHQLEDYFNASSLKFSSLNFSLDPATLPHQPQQQEKQFLPVPISPFQPLPHQPALQNITNKSPLQLQAHLAEIDNKVKHVLKKSMDAQQKYLSSPSGKRFESLHSDSRLSQLDQYAQLPPIVISEVPIHHAHEDDFSQRESFPYHSQDQFPFNQSVQVVQSYNPSVQRQEDRGSVPAHQRDSEKHPTIKQSLSLKHQQGPTHPTTTPKQETHSPALQSAHQGLHTPPIVHAQPNQTKHSQEITRQSQNAPTRISNFQQQHISQTVVLHKEEPTHTLTASNAHLYQPPTLSVANAHMSQQPTQKVLTHLGSQESQQQLQLHTYNSGGLRSDISHEKLESPKNNQASPQGTYNYKQKQSLRDSSQINPQAQVTLGRQDQQPHQFSGDARHSQTSNIRVSQISSDQQILKQLTGQFNQDLHSNGSQKQSQLLQPPQNLQIAQSQHGGSQPALSVKSGVKSSIKQQLTRGGTKVGQQSSSGKKAAPQKSTTSVGATNKLKSQFKK